MTKTLNFIGFFIFFAGLALLFDVQYNQEIHITTPLNINEDLGVISGQEEITNLSLVFKKLNSTILYCLCTIVGLQLLLIKEYKK